MVAKVKQTNPNFVKELMERYKSKDVLAVGYPVGTTGVSTKYPDGTEVLLVAAVNNFGSASQGIPARPFMREGATPAVEATNPDIERLIPLLNQGKMTTTDILKVVGPKAEAAFKETILTGDWVPNKEITIERKGSSRPLTNTGLMRNTLTHVVRPKE